MGQSAINLKDFLNRNKEDLLTRWFHHVLEVYPQETAVHFKNDKNQFANPVGHSLHEGLSAIYDELIEDIDEERLKSALDKVIRVKAVQDVSPSQAILFMFDLKKVIRQSLAKEIKTSRLSDELLAYEDKVDQGILLAFNIYLECRETIYKMRLHEVKTRCDILERINQYNN